MNLIQRIILNARIKPLQRMLASQFGNPTGLLGGMLARLMNKGNLIMNTGVVDQMGLTPEHHALDIGFGGGAALGLMLERIKDGKVIGMEMSADMIDKARVTFAEHIKTGRLDLLEGLADSIPLGPSVIDCVSTVNTVYFWPEPMAAFKEILRVLKPGGRLVIGMRPREVMERITLTKYGFTIYDPEDIVRMMDEAGFMEISHVLMKDDEIGYLSIKGMRPTA